MSHIHMRDARKFAADMLKMAEEHEHTQNLTEAIANRICSTFGGGRSEDEDGGNESPQKELDPRSDRAIVTDGVFDFVSMSRFLVNRKAHDSKDETSDYLLSMIGARFASMINSRSIDRDARCAADSLQEIAFAAMEIARRIDDRNVMIELLGAGEFDRRSMFTSKLSDALSRVGLLK